MIALYLFITLYHMYVHLCKKTFRFTEDSIRLFQETPYQFLRTGHGGVDHHGKFLYLLYLLCLKRLDQGHIPVSPQSVIIIYIIKRVRVNLYRFPHNGKFSQKLSVIILFPVFYPDLPGQFSRLVRCLFGKCLHLRLHRLTHSVPFVFPVRCHPGPVILIRPIRMVIRIKFGHKRKIPPLRKFFLLEAAVNTLGIHYPVLFFQAQITFSSGRGLGTVKAFHIHGIDQIFHGDVTCQIPQSFFPLASCIHMDKYTVQDRVKVQPVHKDAAGHKPAGQKVRLVGVMITVCPCPLCGKIRYEIQGA